MSVAGLSVFNEDTARRLWVEHRQRVANADPGEDIDFRDTVFSEDPEDKYFRGIEFKASADFTGSTFVTGNVFGKAIFHRDAIFNNSIFKEKSDFLDVNFEDTVSFDEAIFSEAVGFHSNFQGNVSFERAIFQSDVLFGHSNDPYLKDLPCLKFDSSLSFDNAEFRNTVSFDNLHFHGNVSFKSTKFFYWSEFVDLEFKSRVSFEYAHFLKCTDSRDKRRNLVRFQEINFGEKASFWGCKFECKARFQKVVFDNVGEFRCAKFGDRVEFIDVKTNGRLFLERNYPAAFAICEDAIVPYRLAKQAASECGNSRWTGNYHFQEQCATNAKRRKDSTLKFWKGKFWHLNTNAIWNYGELLLGRYVFGYGEKPVRPLVVGLGVALVCGFIFWVTKGIDHDPPCSFPSSIYFSVVTFTTLGYGDLQPTANMRWLSGIEAFLGAALMAMFIVALARKFTR